MPSKQYPTHDQLNLSESGASIASYWSKIDLFAQSVEQKRGGEVFHFYEGPPSANGKPGIHHIFARTIKDLFCRYKTMQGYCVPRRSGWDTHGLPVELQVEKELAIHRSEIGEKITVEEYNQACRQTVMRYQKKWEDLTHQMGYWTDLDDPYITCKNSYMANVWSVVKKLYEKGMLYKGHSIQPYSPAAGTGLSAHELNQPGCYKEIKDTTVTAQFALEDCEHTYLLAWTTTPWTLPANTALAIGHKVEYSKIATYNRYTHTPIQVILATDAIDRYFNQADEQLADADLPPLQSPHKQLPWKRVGKYSSEELAGRRYKPILPYIKPEKSAYQIVIGDFVTTEDGTGIVHIAPTFGSDDFRLAQQKGIPSITVKGAQGEPQPIVDRQGRFVSAITDFAGEYVKSAYGDGKGDSVDLKIALKLKKEGKAFCIAPYIHSYPHCWRTDKPILYYPLDAWFVRTTAYKKELIANNKKIKWQPKSTGQGRFGEWLANLVDWNLSRSRYWGTPLPIWRTKEGDETRCIGSLEELRKAVVESIAAGHMEEPLPNDIDLHIPYIDKIVLSSSTGKPMYREAEVIDVWFDSGAMPYAQWDTPVNLDLKPKDFPADFIAEGVDQTRGWFFTLHVLGTLLFDQPAFKQVVATGLVLDKEGNKMSKRLGNTIDPFKLLKEEGADLIRWYMIVNSNPWENLRFNCEGMGEIKRRFFGTLFNTYQFFALYANLDRFDYQTESPDLRQGRKLDQWICARLQEIIEEVTDAYERYSPTQAARAIQHFLIDDVSNWYVRLNRKRFWKGEQDQDKQIAYHTLHYLLTTIAQLAAPIAPFYMEQLYRDLHQGQKESVHLSGFPKVNTALAHSALVKPMRTAQKICSLAHALRKKHRCKVRQPLTQLLIPISPSIDLTQLKELNNLICTEVNVKQITYLKEEEGIVSYQIRPHLKRLGKRYGAQLQAIRKVIDTTPVKEIMQSLKECNQWNITMAHQVITLQKEDLLITTQELPGKPSATEGGITVALDLQLTSELIAEGKARELVNRLQKIRKEIGLKVEDKITLQIHASQKLQQELAPYMQYIQEEVQITKVYAGQEEAGSMIDLNGEEVWALLSPADNR